MTTDRASHPEADLIARARKVRRMTIEAAAAQAGISHQRWRQIEGSSGKQAPPETIAHMAHAVGVTTDRLRAVRPEAADYLEEIELQAATGTDEFDEKMRAIVESLPEPQRKAAEQLLDEYSETQRANQGVIERLFLLFTGRGEGRRNNGEAAAQ